MAKTPGAATPALAALAAGEIPAVLHQYEHDPRAASYGHEAAAALGVEPDRVFKTLMIEADAELCVAIVPVSCTLDLKAVANALGAKKAHLADPARAQRATGYVVGGISPLGQKRHHRSVIDESAQMWETILVSGGRRGLDIELSPADLVTAIGACLADIARHQ